VSRIVKPFRLVVYFAVPGMTTWKKTILFSILIVSLAVGVFFYYSFFELIRIKGILKGAQDALEREDLEGLMSYVSSRYADPYGFDYPMVRRFLSGLFKDFDKFEVVVKDPVIHVEDNRATVRFSLWISVDWNGYPAYIVGTNRAPATVLAYLERESRRWKVVKIEGIR